MSTIMSQELKGTFTHWLEERHKEAVLNGQGKMITPCLRSKPAGVWISWNNGWEEWCSSEMPDSVGSDMCVLNVSIKDGLKIWHIDSLDDFLEMWNKYAPGKSASLALMPLTLDIGFWEWLKEQGIEGVALTDKGQWETRYNTWLYGWDCQCIVIFSKHNVKFTEAIR